MGGIVQFRTRRGDIVSVEVDDAVARAAQDDAAAKGPVRQGAAPMTAKGGEIVSPAPRSFDEAMETLKAYAGGLQDLIDDLDLTPSEVAVEIGLKMSGSAGFIIAKAGAETEMKVSLTWQPKPKAKAEG